MMYVVGGVDENEIMLYNVILAVRDALHLLFKYVPPCSAQEQSGRGWRKELMPGNLS